MYKAIGIIIAISCLALAGCRPAPAQFELSGLSLSPPAVEIHDTVEISAQVTNTGGQAGSYTANLSIDGAVVDSKAISLEPQAATAVTFSYTPDTQGSYTVAIGEVNASLVVTQPPAGEWWLITYEVADSSVSQRMSFEGTTLNEYSFTLPKGTTMQMQVSAVAANGSRELFVGAADFRPDTMLLEDIMVGVDSKVTWMLAGDARGALYVEDGAGDVDVFAESTAMSSPPTAYTFGDGTPDPAGSWLIYMPMRTSFESMGISSSWPVDAYCTTGHSYGHITSPDNAINGSVMAGDGTPCTEDGGPAPFVATGCEIVMTGAIIDRTLMGFGIDVHFMAQMQLKPTGWEQVSE